MGRSKIYHLFEGCGIELEYMIVDRRRLNVLNISDALLRTPEGKYKCDIDRGTIGWSNEFALHVIELKTNDPSSSLSQLSGEYQEQVSRINNILKRRDAMLMPTAMHPWMDPSTEARFWPHGNRRIYLTYDRIFGCRVHGFANIQSMQANLSFSGDEEFGRLHAAVRLVLPLIPAIAASSPLVEGRATGVMDNRLFFYRDNQRRLPSITGRVIPEPVYRKDTYEKTILDRMYSGIASLDPKGVLRHEWLNSRGAIPRFERNAIEVRIVDIQECPLADLAIAAALTAVLKGLAEERWTSLTEQKRWAVRPLSLLLEETMRYGQKADIRDRSYLKVFGFPGKHACANELWQHLMETVVFKDVSLDVRFREALKVILIKGPLSHRILSSLGKTPSREKIGTVYRKLCSCLSNGELFVE